MASRLATPEQKAAHAARMREWRKNNPEAARATDARRRAAVKADPERLEKQREYHRQKIAEWRRKYPERRRGIARRSELIRKYGLTEEEYDERVEAQGGLCAICGNPPALGRRLAIDHDHKCCPGTRSCGMCIRDLLCDACNGGLGLLGDSIERLEQALAYLSKWVSA